MDRPGIRLAELMGDNQGAGEVGQQNEALTEAQALWGPPKRYLTAWGGQETPLLPPAHPPPRPRRPLS